MALQSSGAISISQIKTELGSSSYSLRTLSAAAGKSTPDAMSEFYGYSASSWPSGVVARYDIGNGSSYSGSGNTVYDLSGYGHTMTLANTTYVANSGNPYMNHTSSSGASIAADSNLYGSDFTWAVSLRLTGDNGSSWGGLWWSESGYKNFLVGFYTPGWNSTTNWTPRFDTSGASYVPWNGGMGVTNNGTSPANTTADYTVGSPMAMLAVRKSGNTLTWWRNGTITWTFTGFSTFSIGSANQTVGFLCNTGSAGSYATPCNWRHMVMFNRALSDAEMGTIQSNMTSYS